MTTTPNPTAEPTLGWHEFILDGVATTHIAYIYEDSSIYFPEGPEVVTEADFRLASAAGRVFPLVRAAGLLVSDPTDEQIEAVARELACLDEGDPWPTNAQLGGSLTGDRDMEYRSGMREQARDLLLVAARAAGVAPQEPPHIPYPGEPFDRTHTHDWADGACQHPDCMARLDGTTQPLAPQEPSEMWEVEDLDDAVNYARRYWQHGREPLTQHALTILANAITAPAPSLDREKLIEAGWFKSSLGVTVGYVEPVTDRGSSLMVDGIVLSPNDASALREFFCRATYAAAPVVDEAKPFSVTIVRTARQAGKSSVMVEQLLERAGERDIEVRILPPEVDEAKLAEVVCSKRHPSRWQPAHRQLGVCGGCAEGAHITSEWLRGGGR